MLKKIICRLTVVFLLACLCSCQNGRQGEDLLPKPSEEKTTFSTKEKIAEDRIYEIITDLIRENGEDDLGKYYLNDPQNEDIRLSFFSDTIEIYTVLTDVFAEDDETYFEVYIDKNLSVSYEARDCIPADNGEIGVILAWIQGAIEKGSFTENSTLPMEMKEFSESVNTEKFEETAQEQTVRLLRSLERTLAAYGCGVTLKDLGFEKFE